MELAVLIFLLFGIPLARNSSPEFWRITKKVLLWCGIIILQYLIVFGGH